MTCFLEQSIAEDQIKLEMVNTIHHVTIFTTFLIPALLLEPVVDLDGLMVNLLFNLVYIILAMKLISYIHTNRTMKENILKSNNNCSDATIYPSSLTYKNIFLHWFSPSLVYRPAQSMTRSEVIPIRKLFVIYKFLETTILLMIVRAPYLIIADVTQSLLEAIKEDSSLLVLERFLTLSLVYFISWLISFYIIFLSFLQLVSEVTRSRERMFYHSWWNASNMEEFWRWWNLPVHKWCVKHVYLPVVSGGYGKMMAMSATFLFSATLHEYLISGRTSCHRWKSAI